MTRNRQFALRLLATAAFALSIAACGGGSAGDPGPVAPGTGGTGGTGGGAAATFVRLSISPGNPALIVTTGTSFQLRATDHLSDGSSRLRTEVVSWSSSDESVISVSNATGTKGLALCGAVAGAATVSASDAETGGTATITVIVTEAVPTTLVVSPPASTTPAGYGAQFTARATYSDTSGEALDVTDLVDWSSSAEDVATISNEPVSRGLATGRAAGQTTITATLPGSTLTAAAQLTVTPAVLTGVTIQAAATHLPAGVPLQLGAIGAFSDGSEQDVTGFVEWSASPATVAFVSNQEGSAGVVTGLQVGSAVITAASGGVGDSIDLTFNAAKLLSLEVSASPSRPWTWVGTSTRFTAMGTFDDGSVLDLTRDVTWSVSPGSLASFSTVPGKQSQLMTYQATDAAVTITATDASGVTDDFAWSRIRSRSR